MSPGVPRMISTIAAAGYDSHGRDDWRMAPKTTAKAQHPIHASTKIVSVSRNAPAKNPRLSGMTRQFQKESIARASARRPNLEPEEPLEQVDRADREQGKQQEQQRPRRVGLEPGERLLLDLLRIEHQVRD